MGSPSKKPEGGNIPSPKIREYTYSLRLPWTGCLFLRRLSVPRNSLLGSDNAPVPHYVRPSGSDSPFANKSQRTELTLPVVSPEYSYL